MYTYIINSTYKNGKVLPADEAKVSAFDRGFLYGDLIFETMRAYEGHVFRIEAHLDRLWSSAHELRIQTPQTKDGLKWQIEDLIRLNNLSDAYVRVSLSRGVGPSSFTIEGDFQPTLIISARPLTPYPAEYYREGVATVISSIRQNAQSPIARHKTGNYLANALARHEAKEQGAAEAILLNTEARVAEGSVSNVFIVEGGAVVTPSLETNILPGVTRQTVLEICGEEQMVANEEVFGVDRLVQSDEAFLTNSLMEIMPVRKVGDSEIGRVCPGEITSFLTKCYKRKVEREKEAE